MNEGVKNKIVFYIPDSHALSQRLRIKEIENQRDRESQRLRSARNETKLHRLGVFDTLSDSIHCLNFAKK